MTAHLGMAISLTIMAVVVIYRQQYNTQCAVGLHHYSSHRLIHYWILQTTTTKDESSGIFSKYRSYGNFVFSTQSGTSQVKHKTAKA